MHNKTKNILRWIPSLLIAVQLTVVAFLAFTGFPFIVQQFAAAGLDEYLTLFGFTEILLVVLFLYPRTIKIGFLLLTTYFGGAIATEITHGGNFMVPVIILAVIWIAAYLRKPEIFRGERLNEKKTAGKQKIAA